MSGPGSVTVWLDRLKAGGDRDAAMGELWGRYFRDLVRRAREHLRGRRSIDDGEDVALSAFDGFVRGVEAGKFPKLEDRDDLWRVLLMMAANKARNAVRDEGRAKRGGGVAFHGLANADSEAGGEAIPSVEPEPDDRLNRLALAEEEPSFAFRARPPVSAAPS